MSDSSHQLRAHFGSRPFLHRAYKATFSCEQLKHIELQNKSMRYTSRPEPQAFLHFVFYFYFSHKTSNLHI